MDARHQRAVVLYLGSFAIMKIDDIYTSFIAFAKLFGYTDDNIWRANQNGGSVSPPCCIVAIQNSESDSTNINDDVYDSATTEFSHATSRVSTLTVLMDFYGANSFDAAQNAAAAFEDKESLTMFSENGIMPIESSDPQQLPFVAQDALDYDRFQITCTVNYNPSYTKITDYATEITPETVRLQNF